MIPMFDIALNAGTQARAAIDEATVTEYAELIAQGVSFPPVTVFKDGEKHILADGFHRFYAHKRAGRTEIAAEIRHGSLQDAKLYAYGANSTHGLKRTNADKRKAVMGMLADFPDWADRAIAKHVGVAPTTVSSARSSLSKLDSEKSDKPIERTYTTKHGTQAVMTISKNPKKKEIQESPLPKKEKRTLAGEAAKAKPPEVEGYSENDRLRDELSELAGRIDELVVENAALRAQINGAEDPAHRMLIDDLRAQIKTLSSENNAIKSQRDAYMAENAAMKKQMAYQRKQLEKQAA